MCQPDLLKIGSSLWVLSGISGVSNFVTKFNGRHDEIILWQFNGIVLSCFDMVQMPSNSFAKVQLNQISSSA